MKHYSPLFVNEYPFWPELTLIQGKSELYLRHHLLFLLLVLHDMFCVDLNDLAVLLKRPFDVGQLLKFNRLQIL